MSDKESSSNQREHPATNVAFDKQDESDISRPRRVEGTATTNRKRIRSEEGVNPIDERSSSIDHKNDSNAIPLIPARMVNEFVYCPRLAYLEWVQQEWEPSSDTVEGKFVHRRVEREKSVSVNEPGQEGAPRIVRAVELSSNRLGLVAKIDLLEVENGIAVPVEYKKGKRPHIKHNAWDPDRVQLCVQGLLLQEHGMDSEHGVIYYAGSHERVKVTFDDDLVELTMDSVRSFKESVQNNTLPEPLKDSPKCPRCSLVGICLPDEVNMLKAIKSAIRPIAVKRTTAYPVYLQSFRGKVGKEGGELVITSDEDETNKVSKVRLSEVSQLAIFGNAYITTPAMHELLRRRIPVCWHTYGGWFLGHSVSSLGGNVELRTKQFKMAEDDESCLRLAKGLIEAKIKNCRALLMRNTRSKTSDELKHTLKKMKSVAKQTKKAIGLNELLGYEGYAAAMYFGKFSSMFSESERSIAKDFDFETRNRRPPLDPINAMLSFGYALLVKQFVIALLAVGLDPYKGFMHLERFGRPSLALDLMEPFRPLVVDSVVLTMINNGEVKTNGFITTTGGVAMTDSTRKKFLAAFERRLSQEIKHPLFDYSLEYRRVFELQARLLGRYLVDDIPSYPNLVVR